MTDKEALKLALEAMLIKQQVTLWENDKDGNKFRKAITAIKEALAQPEQKDAARYQHIKGMARAMSLDMGGNHYWHIGLREIRGPNLDEAIDRSIRARGQA